jgi:hypothetical protein
MSLAGILPPYLKYILILRILDLKFKKRQESSVGFLHQGSEVLQTN